MSADATIAGLILAGGLSRRMGGGDKALALAGGVPLAAHAIRRLAPQVGPLALNANGDQERFAGLGLPVLPDVIGGTPGPLAGVVTGFAWLAERFPHIRRLMTVPADSPLFPDDLVAKLAAAQAPLAIAASGGRAHPVFALWDVGLAGDVRQRLEAGERRMGAVTAALGAVRVEWPDTPHDPFFNANTPEELAALERLF